MPKIKTYHAEPAIPGKRYIGPSGKSDLGIFHGIEGHWVVYDIGEKNEGHQVIDVNGRPDGYHKLGDHWLKS